MGEFSLGAPTVTGGIVFIGTDQGHLVALGDPSIGVKSAGLQCSKSTDTTPAQCKNDGYSFVPIPGQLADVPIPDGGDLAKFRKEAALANGRVFVSTDRGHVYMLEPTAEPAGR
jgi:hypothetical protein